MDSPLHSSNYSPTMEISSITSRPRHRQSLSSDRFLGIPHNSQTDTAISDAGGDFSEDDVFWTGDFAESNNHNPRSSSASSSASPVNGNRRHVGKGYIRTENFGILAALPQAGTHSVFNHKASVSSSSSSSSSSVRMIPTVPKRPPIDRQSSSQQYQSAPVNVPVMTEAVRRSRARRQFDEIDGFDDEEEEDRKMLPPHEIVAAKESPALANSVLEGVGRTLKGRDLRQVRNAVWRKTGQLKINTDGGSDRWDRGSFGGLVRDEHGKWVEGFCGNIGAATTLRAELWGIRHALQLCKEKNWAGTPIETDCEIAVKMIEDYDEIENHPNEKIMAEDCRKLIEELNTVVIHIPREANKCADILTKIGSNQGERLVRILVHLRISWTISFTTPLVVE